MKENIFDTIAAIATPQGEGGISVIRISGSKAFDITEKIFFKSKDGVKKFHPSEENNHTLHFGFIIDNENVIDEVLVSIFKEPHSYTGENVIEISSHGGIFITQKILGLILKQGARLAEPGEYTKRAFLNKKLDLSQAEAVADLIKAQTDNAHQSSIRQLEGSLSDYVKKVRSDIMKAIALTELELDFAEEDLEFTSKKELLVMCNNIISEIREIIASYISGKVIRDGVNVVIAGKPNSGKSSLFNALLKSDRAIVSEISGTTRDYIEERIIIDGILFNLTDTAGIRETEDVIESEGIKRSYTKIENADLILFLIDSSLSVKEITDEIKYYHQYIPKEKSLIVFTKKDINSGFNTEGFLSISIKESLAELKSAMTILVNSSLSQPGASKIIITNHRHKLILEKTIESLENAIKTLNDKMSGEFISVDLRLALSHLGEITGETTNDDILNYIFSQFCIGK